MILFGYPGINPLPGNPPRNNPHAFPKETDNVSLITYYWQTLKQPEILPIFFWGASCGVTYPTIPGNHTPLEIGRVAQGSRYRVTWEICGGKKFHLQVDGGWWLVWCFGIFFGFRLKLPWENFKRSKVGPLAEWDFWEWLSLITPRSPNPHNLCFLSIFRRFLEMMDRT